MNQVATPGGVFFPPEHTLRNLSAEVIGSESSEWVQIRPPSYRQIGSRIKAARGRGVVLAKGNVCVCVGGVELLIIKTIIQYEVYRYKRTHIYVQKNQNYSKLKLFLKPQFLKQNYSRIFQEVFFRVFSIE